MIRIDWPLVASGTALAIICAILGPKLAHDWERSHEPPADEWPTWTGSLPISEGGPGQPDFSCQAADEYPTGQFFIGEDMQYHARCARASLTVVHGADGSITSVTTSSSGPTVSGAPMLRCDSPELHSGETCSTHYLAPTVRAQ